MVFSKIWWRYNGKKHYRLQPLDVLNFRKREICLRSFCLLRISFKTYFIVSSSTSSFDVISITGTFSGTLYKIGKEGPHLYNSYRKFLRSFCKCFYQNHYTDMSTTAFCKIIVLLCFYPKYKQFLLGDDSLVWRKLCLVNFWPTGYLHPAAWLKVLQNSYSARNEYGLWFFG